jgi:hypothetical protein
MPPKKPSGEEPTREEIKHSMITMIGIPFSRVPRYDVQRIFRYLEKYCEIKNGNKAIPMETFNSSDMNMPCSAHWIRAKIIDFLKKYERSYKHAKPLVILKKILGEEEYNATLDLFPTYMKDDEDDSPIGTNTDKNFKFEEVDGGSRRTRRRRFK